MQRRRLFSRVRRGFRPSHPMQQIKPPHKGTAMQGRQRPSSFSLDSGGASASSASASYDPSTMESAADFDAAQSAAAVTALDTVADASVLAPEPWYASNTAKVGAVLALVGVVYAISTRKRKAA